MKLPDEDWFMLYTAALLETDKKRLPERIRLAKGALKGKLAEGAELAADVEQRLKDALRKLDIVERTELEE